MHQLQIASRIYFSQLRRVPVPWVNIELFVALEPSSGSSLLVGDPRSGTWGITKMHSTTFLFSIFVHHSPTCKQCYMASKVYDSLTTIVQFSNYHLVKNSDDAVAPILARNDSCSNPTALLRPKRVSASLFHAIDSSNHLLV